MALIITIPGLVRLAIVSDPDELRRVNDAAVVARPLSGRGGLFNRSVAAKLAVFRTPDGDIWPAFRDRHDPLRAEHQKDLEGVLSHIEPLLQRIAPEIAELSNYVGGGRLRRSLGVVVQQAVGRLFRPGYVASEESYEAARTLQAWLAAWPLRAWWIRYSGALQAALDRIEAVSERDMACAHATALAMENIVKSIELMRELALQGGNLAKIDPKDAMLRTLRAPAHVVREARDGDFVDLIRLRSRTLVLLAVETAHQQRASDPGSAFFAGSWNECPAHGLVPALLSKVWQVAKDQAQGGA
ncbi:hypothetical protein A5906_07735 [Bradyrhizobium sacchari]|uniref:Cytochrome P450 n=1 Tax=Bradyrhizobium sacchari TaxID=1399419 RepID=A0A560KL17_9BRAD|nr:hypothetical protein [Bradyrhizobium sacchari]OPY95845.1 hypothetical protein A5906_07735 [Bradyrhizobium sacchari]TWB66724.1 hypothetical protein FBZ94_101402 [Bradyrhizobium sacchari]TWB83961.1 hypothetical protein FBZ95_101402 [Bradyrhizobium sacchari]